MKVLVFSAALLLAPAGAMAQDSFARVTGATQAPQGLWPDTAGVAFGQGYVGCTGTLIAPNVVLTAGHCVDQSPTWVVLDTNDYYRDDDAEWIRVDRTYEYPNSWSSYDIAVLVLEEDSRVEPRVVAQGCVLQDDLRDNAPVAIVGFGTIDAYGNRDSDGKLMEGYSVVTDHDCSDTSRGCNGAVSPGGEIGAGQDGVDACYGDSGGPLYLLTDHGDYLIGVTSRAFWDVSVPCGEGGIWVRPDAVMGWIEDVSGVNIPVPTCNQPPEPTAEPMKVPKGRTRTVQVEANDPDQENGHTYAVAEGPEHGIVDIYDDGTVEFTADRDYRGMDSFVLTVIDSGVPSHGVDVEVPVEIVRRGIHLCSCSVPGSPANGVWLGALGLLLVRRRRSTTRLLC